MTNIFSLTQTRDFEKNNNLDINLTEGNTNKFCEITDVLLKAFTNKSPEIAAFILANMNHPLHDIDVIDKYGRNILHYLIIFCNHEKNIEETLLQVITNKTKYNISKLITTKDKLGNTPKDYATMFNNAYILYLFNNMCGDETNETSYNHMLNNLTIKPMQTLTDDRNTIKTEDIFDSEIEINTAVNDNDVDSALTDIVRSYSKPIETTSNAPLNNLLASAKQELSAQEMSDMLNSEQIGEYIIKKLQNKDDEVSTVIIYSESNGKDKKQEEEEDKGLLGVELAVGSRVPLPPDFFGANPNTEQMLFNIRNKHKSQSTFNKSNLFGGAKKAKGKRKITTFSEMSFGDAIKTDEDFMNANNIITSELLEDKKKNKDKDTSSSSSEEPELASALSEMARNISRQSTVIHERCIEKIAELLKLDLKKPDENKQARYYKAAIWRQVSKEHPELSNYDRSVEMEKRITKDTLKKIDIEQVTSEIESYLSDKTQTEEKPKKKSSKKVEETTEEKPKKEIKKKTSKKVDEPIEEKPKKKSSKKLEDKSNNTLSISTESSISFESSFSY